MTFTYEPDQATDLATVRDAIGDTDESEPLLTDEVILRLIDSYGVRRAGPIAARRVAARFARRMDKSAGRGVTVQWAQRHKHYLELAKELEREIAAGSGYAGYTPVLAAEPDSDLPAPIFTRHMQERTIDDAYLLTGETETVP